MGKLNEQDIAEIQRVIGNAQKTIMDLERNNMLLDAKVAATDTERDVYRGLLLLADMGEDPGELLKKATHYINHPTELSERISGVLALDTDNMLSQGALKVSDDGGSHSTLDAATSLYLNVRGNTEEVQ